MKNAKMILWAAPLIVGLALIRTYEGDWFYDPFLDYFRGNNQNKPYPETQGFRLFLNLFLRYFLNAVLSLAIIQVLFRNREFLKLAAFLYTVFFVILIIVFFLVLYNTENANLVLFYVRRFLIQPIFILLFLPAFYLQTKSKQLK